MPHNISIAIADDHPIVIEGLKIMLENRRPFVISATFYNGEGIRQYVVSNPTDIVLLDISLPDYSGIDLCAEIKKTAPETSVIMFSNRTERSVIMQCLQNGASGYLLKNASLEELTDCLHGVLSGKIVFCKEVMKIIQKPADKPLSEIPRITKRESQILQLVTDGHTSNQIAEMLCLSPLTVETHRKNLLQKFGAKNTAELIRFSLQNQLL